MSAPDQILKSRHGSSVETTFPGGAVRVCVNPAYVATESAPAPADGQLPRFVFMYEVTISNDAASGAAVQLHNRHWIITDADGEQREVRGAGVVGRRPRLAPGESFRYASYCPLATGWGTMEGGYEMASEDGHRFSARVGRFYLVCEE